jgi:DNA gyrase subunit A
LVEDYRITNRGGKGVKTLNVTDKTGELIAIKNVTDEDDLMIINKSGIIIRLSVEELRVMGRATQGVKLINLRGNDEIAAVAKVTAFEEEEELLEDGEEGATESSNENTAETAEDTETSEPTEE